MKVRRFIEFMSSAQSRREALRRRVVRYVEGHAVWTNPPPHILLAEQPTYAPVKVYYDVGDAPVRIGRYCSLNPTVAFITSGGHPLDAVTTFFFYWGMGEGAPEQPEGKGPITVGNDVWMGREALIMSGVTIGDGAAVAARAVVTKDVAPYEIVGGAPARHIGWRFDQQTREELLKIAWWDWPVETVLAHRHQLYGRGDAVVDFIARHGGKVDAMTSAEQCKICG